MNTIQWTTLQFPVRWLVASERSYHSSKFAAAARRMQDRFPFAASYDINPADHIRVQFEAGDAAREAMVRERWTRLLQRQADRGTVQVG